MAKGKEEANLGVAFVLTSPTPTFYIVSKVYPSCPVASGLLFVHEKDLPAEQRRA